MTICWKVPYDSTAVFVVLRYPYGSTVTSTVLVPWKRSTAVPQYYRGTAQHYSIPRLHSMQRGKNRSKQVSLISSQLLHVQRESKK